MKEKVSVFSMEGVLSSFLFPNIREREKMLLKEQLDNTPVF